jgi:hypothetical protein
MGRRKKVETMPDTTLDEHRGVWNEPRIISYEMYEMGLGPMTGPEYDAYFGITQDKPKKRKRKDLLASVSETVKKKGKRVKKVRVGKVARTKRIKIKLGSDRYLPVAGKSFKDMKKIISDKLVEHLGHIPKEISFRARGTRDGRDSIMVEIAGLDRQRNYDKNGVFHLSRLLKQLSEVYSGREEELVRK